LSQNENLPIALEKVSVKFIGPRPHSTIVMGDKIESKRTAMKAKVNIVPGFDGEIKDTNHALEISKTVGTN
jgi:propionyl-CoA carboxylase alpha chain